MDGEGAATRVPLGALLAVVVAGLALQVAALRRTAAEGPIHRASERPSRAARRAPAFVRSARPVPHAASASSVAASPREPAIAGTSRRTETEGPIGMAAAAPAALVSAPAVPVLGPGGAPADEPAAPDAGVADPARAGSRRFFTTAAIVPPGAGAEAPAPAPDEAPGAEVGGDPDAGEGGPPEGTRARAAHAQVVVLGPSVASPGDPVTFQINLEGAEGVSHAPLRLHYNPAVLRFESVAEGDLLASGGAATHFLAATSDARGTIELSLSRMPAAGGVTGTGTLFMLTFTALAEGTSPVVTAGSRLLDSAGRAVVFGRDDGYVAVR